ncbi:hypothetical protein QB607_002990 [Clostridium botulinum]|nr:hypothetical protein [Clostridium botulinum]EKS4395664.1 hypothetical protein [Clostridium botulinum]
MATIGQQLLQPENGWKRYDDTDSNISYVGDWVKGSNSIFYGGSYNTIAYSPALTNKTLICKFNFTGSKIRIISSITKWRSEKLLIKIDNLEERYGENNSDETNNTSVQKVIYEKVRLTNKEHIVEIYMDSLTTIRPGDNSYKAAELDAIDIDENGELRPYNPNLNKYLIKQNSNYYSIDNNYIDLGNIDNSEELNNIIDEYGYNDISILTKELNNKRIPTKLENNYYKSFDINLNDIKDNINLIEENDKKYIEYGCNNYKISDKVKEINDGKFEVLMKE